MAHVELFPMLNGLKFDISTFCSTCALASVTVFCSSLLSWLPVVLLRYFVSGFEMVPVVCVFTGNVLTFHVHFFLLRSFCILNSCVFLTIHVHHKVRTSFSLCFKHYYYYH